MMRGKLPFLIRRNRGNRSLAGVAGYLRSLLMSENGALSVDGIDAVVRALAMTVVVLLSLVGYQRAGGPLSGEGKVLDPLIVAVGLLVYNSLVVAVLGVPWRHRPGFNLFLFDWAVASVSIALTGWTFSPFIILLYALVIGAALRLGFSTRLSVVCACALVFLAAGALEPATEEALRLPVLAVEATSLVMVVVTAAALRRAVEVELRHVELEERSARQFRLLNELINSLLLGTPDFERVTQSVAEVSSSALRGDAGLVAVWQSPPAAYPPETALKAPGDIYLASDIDPNPIQLTESEWQLASCVIKSGSGEVVSHISDMSCTEYPSMARHGRPAMNIISVPLTLEDGSHGAILVGRCSKEAFTDTDVNLLHAIGQQLSVAVRLARLYMFEHERATSSAERERLERDLLSIVSHDLRTPLTAIKMSASALSGGIEMGAHDRLVRNIERNADRLAALVDDLLDMARLRSGRVSLKMKPTNLGELINELAAQVWPMVETKNQSLRVDLPVRGSMRWNSLTLEVDGKRIEQVLLNLIANAHKYSPEGSTITLGATPRTGELRVFVRDEGPGIAPFERDRIFEKFYSGPGTQGNGASQSIGLGLAIARSLVKLHGGEIGVQSRKGGGSTFYFTLPRNKEQATPVTPALVEETPDAHPGY